MFAVDRSGLEDLILYIIAKLSNSKIKRGGMSDAKICIRCEIAFQRAVCI